MKDFEKFIKVVLNNEIDKRNPDKITKDAGGVTKYGIAQRFHPSIDVKNITLEQAKKIYYIEYWLPLCPERFINDDLLLHVFDVTVNSGKGRAIMLLQNVLNVKADGSFGPVTLNAMNNYKADIVEQYKLERIKWYKQIVAEDITQAGNLEGWLNRVNNTHF